MERPILQLRIANKTDVGMVRDHNEDAFYVDPGERFFIVADGMGGHAAGEVASAMAVAEVRKALEAAATDFDDFATSPTDTGRKGVVSVLESAVRAAHQAVYARGTEETDKQGMGTTLDVVLLTGAEAFVAHVGDSRTYLLRDGRASQITTDHTVAEVLVIEGKLSAEEAAASPLRTILVNAIGVSPDVGVEMSHVRLRKDDQLLLCSDGLHDYFPAEEELAEHLEADAPEDALTKLVELAKERGGHDNITGVVVHVEHSNAPEVEDDDFGEDATRPTEAVTAVAPPTDPNAATLPPDGPDALNAKDVPVEPVEGDVSDGVPQPMAKADTAPLEGAEPASQPAEGQRKRGRKNKSTLPLGVEVVTAPADGAEGADNAAAADAGDAAPTAASQGQPDDANADADASAEVDDDDGGASDWDDDAARKTEPMQTVAQPKKTSS